MDPNSHRSSEEAILLEDGLRHDRDTLASGPRSGLGDPASSDPSGDSGFSSLAHHDRSYETLARFESGNLEDSELWRGYQQFLPTWLDLGITACLDRIEGLRSPRLFKISPLLSSFYPLWRHYPRMRSLGPLPFIMCSIFYLIAFIAILFIGTSGCHVEGHGVPIRLSCTDQLWPSKPDCGLNGDVCRPFDNARYAFRCPADCSRVRVLEPYIIGNETINYRTLVIGGPTSSEPEGPSGSRYRGDSFLCPAAIHAGIIPNHSGGTGVIVLTGEQNNFPSVTSNGITSVGSLVAFPLSFTFEPATHASSLSSFSCKDPRWTLLGLTLLYTTSISLLVQSTPAFFSAVFTSTFFCVGLAVDAPEPPTYGKVVSLAFKGFLPAAFTACAIYQFCARRTLRGLSGTFDQTVLWLGGFWIGALNNLTFEKLPVQRLIPHDILKQPGAGVALFVILAFLVVAGVGQALAFRVEGRLLQYLLLYFAIGVGLALLNAIPNVNLRIHHYIIALILLPGTSLQTRPSLVYQGLLVGLFLSGIARWGFASILQVPEELFNSGVGMPPPQISPSRMSENNITFAWQSVGAEYDSMSIMVNDVERFRGYDTSEPHNFTWTRQRSGEPVYFRFALTRHEAIGMITIGDYSNPGTWLPNNTWIPMVEGDAV